MTDEDRKARQVYISEQCALALAVARAWFGDIAPTEENYEEIRAWIVARVAERGITADELDLRVVMDHERKRATFDFKFKGELLPATVH